jgi:hypothetical protein
MDGNYALVVIASVTSAAILVPATRTQRLPQRLLCGILLAAATLVLVCPYGINAMHPTVDMQPSYLLKPTKQNVKRWSTRRLRDFLRDEGISFRQPNRFAGGCERDFLIEKTVEVARNKDEGSSVHYKKLMMEFGLPLVLYFAAYLYMLYCQAKPSLKHLTLYTSRYGWVPSRFTWEAGKYNPNLQYTRWAYLELLFLIPAMPFSKVARVFALTNTFGTAFGINCLYWLTGYSLLREFGDIVCVEYLSLPLQPFPMLLALDILCHWLPFICCKLLMAEFDFLMGEIQWQYAWVGIVTGFSHSSWCFIVSGQWDPAPLYKELQTAPYTKSTEYTTATLMTGWLLVFAAHVLGALVVTTSSVGAE